MQIETVGDSPFYSPITVFSGYRINASWLTANCVPIRDRLLVTAFPSPAMIASCEAFISGSLFPASYFASQLTGSFARSAFRLCSRKSVCPDFGSFRVSGPLRFPRLAWQAVHPIWAPLRDFYLPRDQNSNRARNPRVHLPDPPDSFRSPPPSAISRFSAADQRSRLVTFPEACCSSNLLEPSAVWPGKALPSIDL
jgi:hypothetical protein